MPDALIIFGTRPSYIKLAPVHRALVEQGVDVGVVCTGQHLELIEQHIPALKMPIDRWLDVMRDSTGLNSTLSLVLQRVDAVLAELKPRLVIVHGDTTSGLGSGLAAFHRGIPVAHVEAGLRSGSAFSPYPEEVNRIMLDAMGTLLYAPTALAAERARLTNPIASVEVTGNPVVDSVKAILSQLYVADNHMYRPVNTSQRPYVLLDLHRRESFGSQMWDMVTAVRDGVRGVGKYRVTWPVHPNPAVHVVAEQFADDPDLEICDPLAYPDFLDLARHAGLILTDSGGLVEEACSLGVPTLQLRDHTDRPEAVPVFSWLIGRHPPDIEKLVGEALTIAESWKQSIRNRPNPFGTGDAGAKIARHIKRWLEIR